MRIILTIILLLLQLPIIAQSDSALVRKLRDEGMNFTEGNNLTLLTSGQEKFDDLFAAIRKARHSVHLEYFNFRNDSIAFLLFDVLAERAAEGVEVRALYDAFGNMSNNRPLKKRHITDLRNRGIQIYEFDPIRFPWINHAFSRDHRKIVVIDGEIAYTGGMNVADYYINGTERVGKWRDMHCRLEGPVVNELQEIFIRAWKKVTGEDINDPKYYKATKSPEGSVMCGVANREPHRSPKAIRILYKHLIDTAQDTLRIVNPYFSLTPQITKSLKNAAARGVTVQIMLSEPSDEPLTPDGCFYNANKLIKSGCQVWIYQPGFHHTKILMADDKYCTIGSANLCSRSLRWDYEENVAVISPKVTKQLTEIFEKDKNDSFVLTPEIYKKWRSPWHRFLGWVAHVLSPFM